MTIQTDRIEQIFQDARELQAGALEMLAQEIWSATPTRRPGGTPKRATDALVLARTGEGSGAEAARTPEGGHARGMVRYTAVPARGMR